MTYCVAMHLADGGVRLRFADQRRDRPYRHLPQAVHLRHARRAPAGGADGRQPGDLAIGDQPAAAAHPPGRRQPAQRALGLRRHGADRRDHPRGDDPRRRQSGRQYRPELLLPGRRADRRRTAGAAASTPRQLHPGHAGHAFPATGRKQVRQADPRPQPDFRHAAGAGPAARWCRSTRRSAATSRWACRWTCWSTTATA